MQIEDYRAQAEARRLEIDILNHQTPALKKENHELKLKLQTAQENSKTVDWYLRVMEEGIDTKEIVQKYFSLKDEFKDLKFTTDKKINKLTAQLEKVKDELQKTVNKLEQQQKEVVIPMIDEAVKQQKKLTTLSDELVMIKKNFKIVYSLIRSPFLTGILHKAERNKLSEKQREQADKDSQLVLRQYQISEENAE